MDCDEILEELEHMCRQHCYTNEATKVTDSGCLSANADALRLLGRLGRFTVVLDGPGRVVQGYWPDNVESAP